MASRYFVETLPMTGVRDLPRDLAHHLARVLRARPGDEVVLFDGRGGECRARVTSLHGGRIEADIGPVRQVEPIAKKHVEIAFALPKGARAEWLFEHATEVGATVLRPLLTARSEPGSSNRRSERWHRVVRAAAGQCGRSHLPHIAELESLADLLARPELPPQRYVAQPGSTPLAGAPGQRAILVVGPPASLTTDEMRAATARDFSARGLGPLTLRTETAALAGAVLLLADQGSRR